MFCVSVEFVHTEVECFFDNRRLAAWADVLFLCCLPSQIPKVCVDLRSYLAKHCLVYSFTSAIPVTRYSHIHTHRTGHFFGGWVNESLSFELLSQIS